MFDSGPALRGSGVNAKERSAELMSRATPLTGLLCSTDWAKPILDFRERLNYNHVNLGHFKSLPPQVDNEWEIDRKRSASFGLVQSRLAKLALSLGYNDKYNMHSFR